MTPDEARTLQEALTERDQLAAAILDAEVEARRTIAAELDRVAADDKLTAVWLERHGMGGQLAPPPPRILAALALDIAAGEVHGRRERWVTDPHPGGLVCAEPGDGPDGECGMPVEDGPCTVHHPADGATPPTPEPGGPPRPGQFCTAHFSWLCQAGQGRCQSATAATP